jgi:hypothetical protein
VVVVVVVMMMNESDFQDWLKRYCEITISVSQVIRERRAEYTANMNAEGSIVSRE